MPDIIISTDRKDEPKEFKESDIKEILKAADEYQKLKEYNDKIEAENKKIKELIKFNESLGGRANAGQYIPEKTPEEKAKEEASKILKPFI